MSIPTFANTVKHDCHRIEDVIWITFTMWRILSMSELTDLLMIKRQKMQLVILYASSSDFVSIPTFANTLKHDCHRIENVIWITFTMWRILSMSELTDLLMIKRQKMQLGI